MGRPEPAAHAGPHTDAGICRSTDWSGSSGFSCSAYIRGTRATRRAYLSIKPFHPKWGLKWSVSDSSITGPFQEGTLLVTTVSAGETASRGKPFAEQALLRIGSL